jgi:DNA-binding MarR family transcriptional regulator
MEPDDIIHQSTRLRLMAALYPLAGDERLDFKQMKTLSGATDGNLGAHLATLEKAGYIRIEKDFVGKRPRTRASLTREGRRAFERHLEFLRDILEQGR